MTVGCVVVAAGNGTRLAAGVPKAFADLAGEPLLLHAVRRVLAGEAVSSVVVVVPAGHVQPASALLAVLGRPVRVVAGGAARQASVRAGLAVLPGDVDVVLVHDAARCLAPPALVDAVAAAVRDGHPAVVPGVPVTDTVRATDGGIVDRARLRAVQTPQGFERDLLERAHARAAATADDEALSATDDPGLVERIGAAVYVVPGHPEAFKVTTALDLLLAEALLARSAS
jgi:2-C-methyl-D-erythritol 4-phosphate cytidylyltransferase